MKKSQLENNLILHTLVSPKGLIILETRIDAEGNTFYLLFNLYLTQIMSFTSQKEAFEILCNSTTLPRTSKIYRMDVEYMVHHYTLKGGEK